jgi:hypothetical protein
MNPEVNKRFSAIMLVLNFAHSPTPNMNAYFAPNNLRKSIVDAKTLELKETKTITIISSGKAVRAANDILVPRLKKKNGERKKLPKKSIDFLLSFSTLSGNICCVTIPPIIAATGARFSYIIAPIAAKEKNVRSIRNGGT